MPELQVEYLYSARFVRINPDRKQDILHCGADLCAMVEKPRAK